MNFVKIGIYVVIIEEKKLHFDGKLIELDWAICRIFSYIFDLRRRLTYQN